MLKLAVELSMHAAEYLHAIWLRAARLGAGGDVASDEPNLMIVEKLAAVRAVGGEFLIGAAPIACVPGRRRKLRANVRHLSKQTLP